MKKIKVFLGGYVNFLNAQNINCRALSEHLDKKRFEVSTMLFPEVSANAHDFKPVANVRYIRAKRPMLLFSWVAYLKGIMWADVAYLPKGENHRFCMWIAKLCKTKLFSTLEGLISDTDLSKIKENKREKYLHSFFDFEPHFYSITRFLIKDVGRRRGYHFASEVLYLGVNSKQFLNTLKKMDKLKNIVFIGNKLPTKNIYDFIEASILFPSIKFHIIGDNLLKESTIQEYIIQHNLTNITYHGRLDHTQMSNLLVSMDLMFFPSRSEGFPKVMLETACAGVPTLCYDDYGADEWITSGKDGYVVHTKEEAFAVNRELMANPEKLKELSRNSIELGKRFDWSVLVKKWEMVIEKIYNEK